MSDCEILTDRQLHRVLVEGSGKGLLALARQNPDHPVVRQAAASGRLAQLHQQATAPTPQMGVPHTPAQMG